MAEDVPRNRVVWDEHLLQFAQQRSVDRVDIRRRLPPRVARRYGEGLLRAFEEGLEATPEATLPKPLSQRQGGLLKRLRDIGRRRARENWVLRRSCWRRLRDIEACIRHYRATGSLSDTWQGWRNDVVGTEFMAELEKRA